MKTAAIVLVVAIAGYAIYDLFKGNAGISASLGFGGQITPQGVSVPGVPVYPTRGTTASNVAGVSNLAATAATAFAAAFGPSENQVPDNEVEPSDVLETQFSGLGY